MIEAVALDYSPDVLNPSDSKTLVAEHVAR